jgi:hypothetical protein
VKNWSFKRKKLSDIWPRDEKGEMVRPVFLMHTLESQMEAEMKINLLQAYGIPAVTQYPNNGDFGKVMLGISGTGVDIFVPETMLDDARNIISADIQDTEE